MYGRLEVKRQRQYNNGSCRNATRAFNEAGLHQHCRYPLVIGPHRSLHPQRSVTTFISTFVFCSLLRPSPRLSPDLFGCSLTASNELSEL